jgi:hypothetical protein
MRLYFVSDPRQERDGEHSAQMFPELLKRFIDIDPPKGGVVQGEPHVFKEGQNPVKIEIAEQVLMVGIERVEGYTNGHGFTVSDVAVGQLFQLVAEVQRTRSSEFKRVPTGADMFQVQFGAPDDHPFHGGR